MWRLLARQGCWQAVSQFNAEAQQTSCGHDTCENNPSDDNRQEGYRGDSDEPETGMTVGHIQRSTLPWLLFRYADAAVSFAEIELYGTIAPVLWIRPFGLVDFMSRRHRSLQSDRMNQVVARTMDGIRSEHSVLGTGTELQ
jgi:hypothetical protein